MSSMGIRIRQVLEQRGISQAELARLVGVKQQTISYLCDPERPGQTSRYAVRIAEALGLNPAWLQTGEGEKKGQLDRQRKVPVLTDEQVQQGTGEADVWLTTDAQIGEGAFAMEVAGNSMSPEYLAGDKIIVDPAVPPIPGDYVVAKVDNAIAFRKYRPRGHNDKGETYFELTPVNPDFPSMRSDITEIQLLGTVIEHRKYRR